MTVFTETVKITPAIATKWLEANTHNRAVSQRTVKEYAEQMAAGQWKLNGSTISFDSTDTLTDGQHRLWACIEANVPFKSLVVRGLGTDVFDTIDTGHKRTHADVLHVAGIAIKHEKTVAATANLVMRYQQGTMNQRKKVPAQVTLQFVRDNPEIIEWVTKLANKRSWVKIYATSVAAVAYLASKRYRPKVQEFVDAFVSGENLVAGSPVLALRNRLATEKNMRIEDRTALCVQAWNAFVQGRALSKMQLYKGDNFPTVKGA
jgi:hypothetical protein